MSGAFLCCLGVGRSVCAGDALPIQYTSDEVRVTFHESGQVREIVLQGNVRVLYGDYLFRCARAVFDNETGRLTAEGGVTIESAIGTFTAQDISYHVPGASGILNQGSFSLPPFHGKARTIRKDGDRFLLLDGYLTTCDRAHPHYRVRCRTVEYVPGEYARARGATFVFGKNTRVFYLPRWTQNLKSGKPSLVVIPGYRTEMGRSLSLVWNHVPGNRSGDMLTTRIDTNLQGTGAGLEYSSEKRAMRGKGFLFFDWENGEIKSGGIAEWRAGKDNRFGPSHFILNWRWMEDSDFFRGYFEEDYYAKEHSYNHAALSQQMGPGIAVLGVRQDPGETVLTTEKLPEAGFLIPPVRLGSLPLYVRNDVRVTRFATGEGETTRILQDFSVSGKVFAGPLVLRPWASVSGIEYYRSREERFNVPREAGIEWTTVFRRSRGDGAREYLIPSVCLLARDSTYGVEQLPAFDTYEERPGGTWLSLGGDWSSWRDGENSGKVHLKNLFDVGSGRFSDSFLKYEFSRIHGRNISFQGENVWSFGTGDFLLATNDLIFSGRTARYSVGTRYMKDVAWGIENWWEQTVKNTWTYRLGLYYDFEKQDVVRQSCQVSRNFHCWNVRVSLTRDGNDTSVYVLMVPTAFLEPETWMRRFTQWK